MLHREGSALIFAVSHVNPTCSKLKFNIDTNGIIHMKLPSDACKKPIYYSSVLIIPVPKPAIIQGYIELEPPEEWREESEQPRFVFRIRDGYFDPFEKERKEILGKEQPQ